MNRLQLLLCKLAEEGSEIAQISLDVHACDLGQKPHGQPFTNAQRIHHELHDIVAATEMLNEEFAFNYYADRERFDHQVEKANTTICTSSSLLILLAKLSAAVSQITLKTQQFGLHEIRVDGYETNAQRVHHAMDDLWRVVAVLNQLFGFNYTPDRDHIEAKKVKVNKYAELSISLGQVIQ